jgi:hypothetical protein
MSRGANAGGTHKYGIELQDLGDAWDLRMLRRVFRFVARVRL